MSLGVGEGESDEEEAEDTALGGIWRNAVVQKREKKEQGADEFDDRITRSDSSAAVTAASTENEPAKDRNVVERGDGGVALRAGRARRDDGHATRQPVNADVEKAAEDEAETEKSGSQKPIRIHAQISFKRY